MNRHPLPLAPRSIGFGLLATALMLGIYLAIISLVQGPAHAVSQLGDDAVFVALIATGFGVQIAMFTELRAIDRQHRAGALLTAASTGTSGAAMLACCAHHLVDLVPLLGLSAAAVFLNAYRTELFFLGITMNLLGVLVIARQLARARRACSMAI